MKKIVITGKDSYIGSHIKDWLITNGEYNVEELDVQSEKWMEFDFAGADSVIHVAGIVHKPNITDWNIYERINVHLPVQIAIKAKKEGVKQFVFLSTMAVYGQMKKLRKNVINSSTPIQPIDMYGKSKYIAENELHKLEDDEFKIIIVRPPNVYGRGCKGNYISKFTSIAKMLPVVPYAYCGIKQSMIYIDNLSNFIKILIDDETSGTFMPQDDEIVSAVELLKGIGEGIGRTVASSRILGIFIYFLKWIPLVKKAYGGIEYSRELSNYCNKKYTVISFNEAIKKTVGEM